jgi:hypothetical protein
VQRYRLFFNPPNFSQTFFEKNVFSLVSSIILRNFAPEMIQIILISGGLLAVGMVLLLVKVLLQKNGSFSSQHIHDSEAMRERGIHCVMDQDREMRRRKPLLTRETTIGE